MAESRAGLCRRRRSCPTSLVAERLVPFWGLAQFAFISVSRDLHYGEGKCVVRDGPRDWSPPGYWNDSVVSTPTPSISRRADSARTSALVSVMFGLFSVAWPLALASPQPGAVGWAVTTAGLTAMFFAARRRHAGGRGSPHDRHIPWRHRNSALCLDATGVPFSQHCAGGPQHQECLLPAGGPCRRAADPGIAGGSCESRGSTFRECECHRTRPAVACELTACDLLGWCRPDL